MEREYPVFDFFARNSGRKFRVKLPSASLETSPSRPDKLLTSEALRPEANITKKHVLIVSWARGAEASGSNLSEER